MSRAAPPPFKTLKVHTGAAAPVSVKTPSTQARFAELLQRRPAAPCTKAAAPSGKAPGDPLAEPASVLASVLALDTDESLEDAENTSEPAASEATPVEPVEQDAWEGDAPAPVNPPAGVQAPCGHAIAEYLAHTVAGFCNDPAVQGMEGWQVSMPLRDDLLAATTLHLHLSPHWLLLRFDTHDKGARHLILQHQGSLQDLLDETLAPRRDIAITFD